MIIEPLDQNTIEEIKKRLIPTYNPREIYILEPKNDDYNIDINILVVVDGRDIEHYELMTKGHKALVGVKVAKNILVYTKEEFENYSQDTSTLSFLIKRDGKRIYANA